MAGRHGQPGGGRRAIDGTAGGGGDHVRLPLVVAIKVWGTDVITDREQERISDGLRDDWSAPVPPRPQPEFGDAFAFLHIPAFGPEWKPRAVIEGTDPQMLVGGPGHFVHSAMPGQIGNFAVAGHRVEDDEPGGDRRRPRLRRRGRGQG